MPGPPSRSSALSLHAGRDGSPERIRYGCGGDIRLIAFITDPAPIRKILLHLGEPLAPARGPPTSWAEFVQETARSVAVREALRPRIRGLRSTD